MSKANVLVIDAFNIKSGGGILVLDWIIELLKLNNINYLIVSNQVELKTKGVLKITKYIFARDIFLSKQKCVLYLSNIPPMFRSKNQFVLFYLHQRYWVDLNGYKYMNTFNDRIKFGLKYIYFQLFKKNISLCLVQTKDMLFLTRKNISQEVIYMPIFNFSNQPEIHKVERCLIIGDSSPHKRLNQISSFLKFLSDNNIEYVFVGYKALLNSDGSMSRWFNYKDYSNLLANSKYVFIQSDFESLGIPFIESSLSGCVMVVPKTFPLVEEVVENIYNIDQFKQSIVKKHEMLPARLRLEDCSGDLILLINELFAIND